MTNKNIAVIGCLGKMGKTLCKYLLSHDEFEFTAGIDTTVSDTSMPPVDRKGRAIITSDLQEAIKKADIDIAVDFTAPASVVANAKLCLENKISMLIGTTGISASDTEELAKLAEENRVALMIVPNFALGAILMMDFCEKAAKYMPNAEIIELHHDQKIDKPSGTALKTRLRMAEVTKVKDNELEEKIPIHSVRLPGLVAHQQVVFGALGQTLTIKHDSLNRESFMPGIGLALSQMDTFIGLRSGLKL